MQSPHPPVAEQSCKSCRYLRTSDVALFGKHWHECRHGAPHFEPRLRSRGYWPEVHLSQWCGKWAPAEGL